MSTLKICKLPDTTPVRMTVSLSPELNADLSDYARVYEQTYGDAAKPVDLIPSMLASFMAGDGNFKKARKALNA